MTFANNIRVLGVVLTLAVRSSWPCVAVPRGPTVPRGPGPNFERGPPYVDAKLSG